MNRDVKLTQSATDKINITQENPYRIYIFCAKWQNNEIETNERTKSEQVVYIVSWPRISFHKEVTERPSRPIQWYWSRMDFPCGLWHTMTLCINIDFSAAPSIVEKQSVNYDEKENDIARWVQLPRHDKPTCQMSQVWPREPTALPGVSPLLLTWLLYSKFDWNFPFFLLQIRVWEEGRAFSFS